MSNIDWDLLYTLVVFGLGFGLGVLYHAFWQPPRPRD